jgi:hypothetical protein
VSDLVIACPRIVADRIECSTETWQDVRQAEDLSRSLFTGDLKAFRTSGNDWTAWYESRGFQMLIENKAGQVTVKETHRGELLSLCIFPERLRMMETIKFRREPLRDGEASVKREWEKKGVQFLTTDKFGGKNMFGYYPDGFLFTVTFVLRFDELLSLADLFDEWKIHRPFTVFGHCWPETFAVNFQEGRCGSELESEEGVLRRMSGYIPRIAPVWQGEKDRALTVRQAGVIVCLTVVQRDVETLAEELLAAGLIENTEDSERFAIACYSPASATFGNVGIQTPDRSRRLFLAKIALPPATEFQYLDTANFREKLEVLTAAGRKRASGTKPGQHELSENP